MAREFRVAVGAPDSRRSTVWKLAVTGNDIYILTRMFGADAKVSLHASGECQWSGTSVWVKKDARRRNADRHIVKWRITRPVGNESLHAFRIIIPHSELRTIPGRETLTDVDWLAAPLPGHSAILECYITRPSPIDPAVGAALPHSHLVSLQLTDESWLVVLTRSTANEENVVAKGTERRGKGPGIYLTSRTPNVRLHGK